jgi:hypothetical protein
MNRWRYLAALALCVGGCESEADEAPPPVMPVGPAVVMAAPATPGAVAVPARAQVLLRASQRPDLCIDAGHRGDIHMFHCHGRLNQRWAFVDQRDGSFELVDARGHCIGGATPGDHLDLVDCTGPATRYHFDAGRLTEATSGACVTATELKSLGHVYLDTCAPDSPGQVWAASAITPGRGR